MHLNFIAACGIGHAQIMSLIQLSFYLAMSPLPVPMRAALYRRCHAKPFGHATHNGHIAFNYQTYKDMQMVKQLEGVKTIFEKLQSPKNSPSGNSVQRKVRQ